MYFSFANAFFPSKFPQMRQSLSRFAQCGSGRHAIAFLKSVKYKSNFSNIRMTRNSENKNKSYDKTALRNDPGKRILH